MDARDGVCESDSRRVCAGRLQADVERPAIIEDVIRTTESRQAARATTGLDRIFIEHAIPHLLQSASQSRAPTFDVARHKACYVVVEADSSHRVHVLCAHNDLLCLALSLAIVQISSIFTPLDFAMFRLISAVTRLGKLSQANTRLARAGRPHPRHSRPVIFYVTQLKIAHARGIFDPFTTQS